MTKFKSIVLFLLTLSLFSGFKTNDNLDYVAYHKGIGEAEQLLSEEQFKMALLEYEKVFAQFDFVFLRDYRVVSQLALYLGDKTKAFYYINKGIEAGWQLKDIKKKKFFKVLKKESEWAKIEQSYGNLRSQYETRIDRELKDKVRLMYKDDQKKAMGALFKIGNKAQEDYGTNTFAPHSENQIFELIEILNKKGYPGEKIIGNDYWMSTILSHHNSISLEYSKIDTLYNFVKPKLISAVAKGEMSPYEFALVDDWKLAVSSGREMPGYGFLNTPKDSTLDITNELRQNIGLRSIEVRNRLVEVEKKTGMNFYLPDWVNGKIKIE